MVGLDVNVNHTIAFGKRLPDELCWQWIAEICRFIFLIHKLECYPPNESFVVWMLRYGHKKGELPSAKDLR
jgi:hypothetical protein